MFLQNCWYAAAWSHEVQGETMLSRKLLGKRVLFHRLADGSVVALPDRCSHRFAPLSLGRKEGDCIRCMYHGLIFDKTGKCIEEPGRTRPSPGTDLRAFPVAERWKLLWIWMGDPELADPDAIPDCHRQDSLDWASIPAYMHYTADYRLILDNLLDFSHASFVHEATFGGSDAIAATKPRIESIGFGVRMTRWYLNLPAIPPYLKGLETFTGPVDRWHIYELMIEGNVFRMDSGSAPAGTGAPDGHRVAEAMQFHATQIMTPEDTRNTHFFWTYAHNFNLNDPDFTARLAARVEHGFIEDKLMIEAQQKVINESGEDGMAHILADNGVMLGRRILAKSLDAERTILGEGTP